MKKNSFRGIIGMAAVLSAALVFGLLVAGCGSSPKAAAPDLTGVSSYYVRADGDDQNAGTSEAAPFKTLQRAVEAAAKTSVKKITVIGTLNGSATIKNANPPVLSTEIDYEVTVLEQNGQRTSIVDTTKPATIKIKGSYDEHDPGEILITGKPGAAGTENAVLTDTGNTDNILLIESASVRLENIEISGFNSTNSRSRCIRIRSGVLTLGQNAKITGNTGIIGIHAINQSVVIMRNNAEVSRNEGPGHTGVYLESGSAMVMLDDAAIRGNKATAHNGGGVGMQSSTLIMRGNSTISGNSAGNAGGGIVTFPDTKNGYISQITMEDNAVISGNTAKLGGGILLQDKLILRDNAKIIENTATERGGGVWGEGEATVNKGQDAVIANNTAPEAPDSNFTFE
ncbi:MAG: hypothetical protein LBK61_03255 [Spirochaetaceae bacterium]|jgi:hypothetical protein|nr:hypothetical protein [Spirochaetaceae bacterium]